MAHGLKTIKEGDYEYLFKNVYGFNGYYTVYDCERFKKVL